MFYWSLTEIIWRYLIESQVTDWQIFIDNEMAWIFSGLNFSAPLSRWKSICHYKRLSEIYLVLPNLTGLGRIEIDHHLSVTCVGSAGLQFIYLAGGRLEENKKKEDSIAVWLMMRHLFLGSSSFICCVLLLFLVPHLFFFFQREKEQILSLICHSSFFFCFFFFICRRPFVGPSLPRLGSHLPLITELV